MKLVWKGLFIGLLALSISCSVSESIADSETTVSTNQAVDSLELARKNRVDSVSQIKMPSSVKPHSLIKPQKGTIKE